MKKKLKELVAYFTVRNVIIDMHNASPENIAELKRLEFVFYFRPAIVSYLMFGTWIALVYVPTMPYFGSLSIELHFRMAMVAILMLVITGILLFMEGQRLKTHLVY